MNACTLFTFHFCLNENACTNGCVIKLYFVVLDVSTWTDA